MHKKWKIHHIDGNPFNNTLTNLYICEKQGLHVCIETLINHNIIDRFSMESNLIKYLKIGGNNE